MSNLFTARRLAMVALALVVLAGGIIAPYAWSGSHALRPGLKGCGMIRNADPRIECIRNHVLASVKKDGLKAALVELDSMPRSPQRLSECHAAMHLVGRRIARTTKVTGNSLVSGSSAQACSSGVAHGALEQVVADDPQALQQTAAAICLHTRTRREAEACFHGAGHGLVRAKRPAANNECSSLRVDGGAGDCLAGASMERSMRTTATKDIDANVKLARKNCAGDNDIIVACYVYFPYAVLPPGVDWTLRRYVDVCNRYARPGAESWGCPHRSSNTVKSRDEIDGCTRLKSDIAVQVCAASIAAESDAGQLPTPKAVAFCTSHKAVAFGCGAGIGRVFRWKSTPTTPLMRVADTCKAIPAGDVRDGCVAGASACWFPERVDRSGSECRAVKLPSPLMAELHRFNPSQTNA